MLFRASPGRGATLRLGAWLGVGTLIGCPQLLDDGFDVSPALPAINLDSGSGPGASPDASSVSSGGAAGSGVPSGGTSGAAGTPGDGGAGGDEELPDASASGAGGAPPGPEAGPPIDPPVTELGALLAHRYRFDGSGSTAFDTIGSAHGAVIGTTLTGSGKAVLSGTGEYVDLPSGIVSSLESVTIEAWVNWLADPESPSAPWQTVFDFGTNTGTTNAQATTHVYLAAMTIDSLDVRAGYSLNGDLDQIMVDGDEELPASTDLARGTQVAFVVDAAAGKLSLYVNGALEVASPSGQSIDLSLISDLENWLGRSQYGSDPYFLGELLDVRIYAAPLNASQVTLSFGLGADADL